MKQSLFTIALAALLSIVSCQTIDDNPTVNVSTSDLLGFWEGDKGTRLEFCPDGTYYYYLNDDPDIWMPADDSIHTYTLEDDILTVNWTTREGSSYRIDSKISYLDDESMTFIDLSDNTVETYKHLKAGEAPIMGVFRPKTKIKECFCKSWEDNVLVSEEYGLYHWNDGLLSSVEWYSSDTLYAVNYIFYDGLNRVSRNDYVDYSSDGKTPLYISRMDHFYKDRLLTSRYATYYLNAAGDPIEKTGSINCNYTYRDGKLCMMTCCSRGDNSWEMVDYYHWDENNNCIRDEYAYSDEPGISYHDERSFTDIHSDWLGYWNWRNPEWILSHNECREYTCYANGEMIYHSDIFNELDAKGRVVTYTEIYKYTDDPVMYKYQETYTYED